MKKTALSVVAGGVALLAAQAGHAGSYTAPIVETPVVVTASPVVPANSWTGFYAGAQLSYSDFGINLDGVDDVSGGVYGLHAGYDHQFHNNLVVGGELTYDHSSAENDVWQVERLMSVRAKLGYAHHAWLFYTQLGYAHVRTEGSGGGHGKSGGAVAALGFDYAVNDNWSLGGAFERYTFDNFNSNVDGLEVDGNLLKLKASYRF